jgi:hypothetical protein
MLREDVGVAKDSLLLTAAQRRQLFTMIFGVDRMHVSGADTHLGWRTTGFSPFTAQAMLTHGRFLRLVSRNRGDVVVHVELSDFLSCHGQALTTVPHEIDALTLRTRRDELQSPFWVTKSQATELCTYGTVQCQFHFVSPSSSAIAEAFASDATSMLLTCGTSEATRYVNWGTLCSCVVNAAALRTSVSFFRCFHPINVRTKQHFAWAVELRLRVEAMSSDCWCSVWGSAEDYESCGFRVLDGALGVDVFDDLGNPSFLVHALCTTTPLEVYAARYPNDCICMATS